MNIDIENLARAMGVPKDTFSDIVNLYNSSDLMAPASNVKYPINAKTTPKKDNRKSQNKSQKPPVEKDAVQFLDTGLGRSIGVVGII